MFRSFSIKRALSDFAKEFGLDVAKFEDCLKTSKFADRVAKDLNEAVAAGGRGTPHSIIISADGEQIPLEGAQPYNVVKTTIDTLLE
jgi:predicted DsbA family dithiol-disulfide isomerase